MLAVHAAQPSDPPFRRGSHPGDDRYITTAIEIVGARRLEGWGNPAKSPAKLFTTFFGEEWIIEHRRWLDHLYRVKYSNGGLVFRSEPYWLDQEAFDDFRLLQGAGWRIKVGGPHCHHPSTVVVSISRFSDPEY